MRPELVRRFPQAVFLGARQREELAAIYAAADVFVFPSRTDTFGLVMLEALACGVPVAAFPVPGPRDVIGNAPVGVLDNDLRAAALRALAIGTGTRARGCFSTMSRRCGAIKKIGERHRCLPPHDL